MPTFFFDCFDGRRRVVDGDGIDLVAEAEARDHAVLLVRSLLIDALPDADPMSAEVTVRAADGATIYVARTRFTGGSPRDRDPGEPAPDRG